mmetsp:Transcript_41410/g.133562  ORF Transcript_41410/g.133562 Transcript_41410/m.133562 type:complete len:337 (+) Transcript_41410:109-1119(+)
MAEDLLLHAAARGDLEEVSMLLERGRARADSALPPSKTTPLHAACRTGGLDMAELLIRWKADLNAKEATGCGGRTALHIATQRERGGTSLASVLLRAGASPIERDARGQTPLHTAAQVGQADITRLLLAQGSVQDTSHHGGSPRPSDVAQDDVMEHLIRIELKLGTLSDRLGPGSDGVNTQQAAAPRDRRLGGPVAVHGLQHIVGSTIDTEVEISDGAWFGEGCLLEEGRLFIATVFAVVESELALLPAAEYLKEEIERGVKDGVISVEELRYKPPKKVEAMSLVQSNREDDDESVGSGNSEVTTSSQKSHPDRDSNDSSLRAKVPLPNTLVSPTA